MPVVGRNAYIIENTGKIVDINPFTPDYKSMQVPMVDAAVKYDCPYTGRPYILVIRNALYVPSMQHNLLPPLALREVGIDLCDVPKIQVKDSTEYNHAITFPETGFRIPLSLWGVFSYFPTSRATDAEMLENDDVYLLTPANWNPHQDAYSLSEESMLNWEGHMADRRDRVNLILSDVKVNPSISASII